MDPKGKRMVVNDKEKESLFNEPRDDKEKESLLMERVTHFGVIKCVVTYFLSIIAFRKLWKMECILIVLITLCLSMNKFIRMPKPLLFC
jgi:hypothetical protein